MSGNVEIRRPYGGEEGYKVDFSHDENGYICARVKVTPAFGIAPTVVAWVYDDPDAIPEPDDPPDGIVGLPDNTAAEPDIWLIPGNQHEPGIPGAVVDTEDYPGSPNFVAVWVDWGDESAITRRVQLFYGLSMDETECAVPTRSLDGGGNAKKANKAVPALPKKNKKTKAAPAAKKAKRPRTY